MICKKLEYNYFEKWIELRYEWIKFNHICIDMLIWIILNHLAHSDLGGTSSRTLALNVDSGAIELKHYAIQMGGLPTNRP